MKLDPNLVARGWVDLQIIDPNSEDFRKSYWARERVLEALDRDGLYVWEIIEQILLIDHRGEFTEALADEILNGFLSEHGPKMMSRVEARAGQDANLRKALRSVFLPTLSNQVRNRVERLLK